MKKLALAAALSVSLVALSATSVPEDFDWSHYGGEHDEASYAPLEQIDTESVSRLGLAWSLDLPGEQALEATPLEVDGVIYFNGTYGDVYAVSVEDGSLLWKHEVKVYEHNPAKMKFIFPLKRGVAYEDGRVFAPTTDGRLIALDAKTGDPLWTVETVERDDKRFITGAPRTFNGKVIIGQGGGDTGQRGYVTAYDQATGKQIWRFYTVPGSPEENKGDPAMEMAAKSWTGEYWKTGTGGTPWHGITFDPELNQIYIGTGNSGPYDPEVRSPGGGDNLFLASIVAVDADTGEYVWHYQVNPREAWDWKATAGMTTATLEIDGKPRKVLMQAPTNGFFYVIDRVTGKLISAEKTGKVTWAERIDVKTGRPVENPNIRYQDGPVELWPSPGGTHNWMSMSYNPETGLVYIPYMQLGATYKKDPDSYLKAAFGPTGPTSDPHEGKGALLAWDPVAQKERWRIWHDTFWNGGTLSTGGNLVFQGSADGYLRAHNATTGEVLWRFNTGLGIIAPPISYLHNGTQYVSLLVGWAGPKGMTPSGWRYNAQPRRLLTFKLDGKAKLPATAPYDETVYPVDDPALVLDPADVAAGERLYHHGMEGCDNCHGPVVVSTGAPAPDLRESALALDKEAFWAVVHDGALLSSGMPQFQEYTRQEVGQLYSYVRAMARKEIERQKKEGAEKKKSVPEVRNF